MSQRRNSYFLSIISLYFFAYDTKAFSNEKFIIIEQWALLSNLIIFHGNQIEEAFNNSRSRNTKWNTIRWISLEMDPWQNRWIFVVFSCNGKQKCSQIHLFDSRKYKIYGISLTCSDFFRSVRSFACLFLHI